MFKVLKLENSYRKLFYAGIINGIGDRFSQVALLTLILQMTGSGLSVGITLALRMLPFLLFGPISSKVADKISRKKLLFYTDIGRGFIALSFLFINSPSDLWIIYLGSFLLASGEALYAPTRRASIPAIVEAENIKTINSWEQVLLGFVLVFGAVSGGVISFIFGAKAAFSVNIISFFVAGLIIKTIPSLEVKQKNNLNDEMNPTKFSQLFSVILSSSLLLMLFSMDFVIPLTNGIENVLISVYAVEVFNAADLGVGLLYGVLGTGFILSPLITKKISGHYLVIGFICMILQGVILIMVSQSTSFVLVVLWFGILTIFGGVGNSLIDTVVMETVPPKFQGLYFGISATINNTIIGSSMFISGLLLEFLHPRTMGAITGLLYLLFGLIYLCWTFYLHFRKRHRISSAQTASENME